MIWIFIFLVAFNNFLLEVDLYFLEEIVDLYFLIEELVPIWLLVRLISILLLILIFLLFQICCWFNLVVNIILVIDSIFVVNSNLIVPTKGSNLFVEEVDSNLLLIKNSCEGCCRFWKKLGYTWKFRIINCI